MFSTLSDDAFFTQFGNAVQVYKSDSGMEVHYSIDAGEVRIGFKGPFYQFAAPKLPASASEIKDAMHGLILAVQAERFTVRTPPKGIYPDEARKAEEALKSLGFQLDYEDTDHFVSLQGELPDRLSRTNQKKVRRANALGYRLELGPELLKDSHSVIDVNRRQLSKPSLISQINKELLQKSLRDRTIFGVVRCQSLVLAGVFCLYLNKEVVYVAQWGDDRNLLESKNLESPIPFLFVKLSALLTEKGVKYLYLGSSSNAGLVDAGLSQFKESLGCLPTSKQIWRLTRE